MRLSSMSILFLAPCAIAAAVPLNWTEIISAAKDYKVPGDNPFNYCGDPSGYILDAKQVDMDPNPPKKGQQLTITGDGFVKEPVVKGATVTLKVNWGWFTVIDEVYDLCDNAQEFGGVECPIEGELKISKTIDVSNDIPSGRYTLKADVKNKDGKAITCFGGSLNF